MEHFPGVSQYVIAPMTLQFVGEDISAFEDSGQVQRFV